MRAFVIVATACIAACTMSFDDFVTSSALPAQPVPTPVSDASAPTPDAASSTPVITDAAPDTSEAATSCDEPDLVAHWKFDGDLADCTSHALHGSITGPTRFEPGHADRAIALDGTSFVSIANALPMQAFTIATWIKPSILPTTTSAYVVGKTSNIGIAGWRLGIDPTTTTSLLVARGNDQEPFGASCNCAQVGKWFHFAGVFQPNGYVRLYIDGKLTASSAVDPPNMLVDSPSVLRIGARGDALAETHFKGLIDDMRLYGRALDDAELANIALP